jgi:hypothetical protein
MYTLVTLEALRRHLAFALTDTAHDARLLSALRHATQHLESATHRVFIPYKATLIHRVNQRTPHELHLEDSVLQLLEVRNADQINIPLNTLDVLFDSVLCLNNGIVFSAYTSVLNAINVTAIWGYHHDYAQAWLNVNSNLSSAINANQTQLTVNANVLSDGMIGQGQLIRLDDEFCIVSAVNITNNTLMVLRAANGTTATNHAINTPVFAYQVPQDIQNACLRWAAFFYANPDILLKEIEVDALVAPLVKIAI